MGFLLGLRLKRAAQELSDPFYVALGENASVAQIQFGLGQLPG